MTDDLNPPPPNTISKVFNQPEWRASVRVPIGCHPGKNGRRAIYTFPAWNGRGQPHISCKAQQSNKLENVGNYRNSNHTFSVHSFLIFAMLYAKLPNPKVVRSSAVNNPTTAASCTSLAVRGLPCASAYLTQRLKIPGKSWTCALEKGTLCPALNSSAARPRK